MYNHYELKRRPVRVDKRSDWLRVGTSLLHPDCATSSSNLLKSWESYHWKYERKVSFITMRLFVSRYQPKWHIAKSDVTPKRCSFKVFKEHWNFSEPMSGGHSLFGCYRQYHQKRKGSPPFYVHELIVRIPQKTCSPLPVAKCLTSDHITASVTYFLEALMTDVTRAFGHKAMQSPVMLICDGSMALIAV